MDSLIDYIRWMGDFSFAATGFRDVDALVLCALSYVDLSPMFEGSKESILLRDCRRMIEDGSARIAITGKEKGYLEILQEAAKSERFGTLCLTDYRDILSEDPPVQFSAVCFHDDTDLSFLAYRGTDSSLAGWREDFMISFSKTDAQELAKEYAETVVRPGRRWMMGGHSKGGNLALYASCTMEEEKLSHVERVFILDGPGLCSDVVDRNSLKKIEQKATGILPEFSVVGKLFDPELPDTKIVRSSAVGILQHSIVSWEVDHGKPAYAEKNDSASLWVNEVMERWISNMSREERIVFVDDVFDALTAGGATTLEELVAQDREAHERIRQRFQFANETTKHILADLPKQAILNSLFLLKQIKEKK